jgi:hypothetical protein
MKNESNRHREQIAKHSEKEDWGFEQQQIILDEPTD